MTYLEYLDKEIRPLVARRAFIFFISKSSNETCGFPPQEDFIIFDKPWKYCDMSDLVDQIMIAAIDDEIDDVRPGSIKEEMLAYVEAIREENPIFSRMDRDVADEYLYEMLEDDEGYGVLISMLEEGIERDLRFMLMREMVKYN